MMNCYGKYSERTAEGGMNLTTYSILFILFITGCATNTSSTPKKISPSESPTHAMKVAVAPLSYEPARTGGFLADSIVKDFKSVNLFRSQKRVNKRFTNPSNEQLNELKTEGFDALLTGEIETYWGGSYVDDPRFEMSEETGKAMTPLMHLGSPCLSLGLATAATAATTGKERTHLGEVKFTVRLVETYSGKLLWQGEALGSFRETDVVTIPLFPADKEIEEAKKIAISSLIEQLRNASISLGNTTEAGDDVK